MDETIRRRRIWKLAYPAARAFCRRRYHMTLDPITAERPYLLIANHTTNFLDILLVAFAAGKEPLYFIGSEHILRSGWTGRLLQWAFGLIARPKGAPAMSTVRDTIKTLKAGIPVCLFAEGNASWDGRNVPVVEGTGSLVRASGVPLVTYRLEGSYLCRPRWSRSFRRGNILGRQVRICSPEELSEMSSADINSLIEQDIREDVWERQKREMQSLPGRHRAEYLERLLYLCPSCRHIGTLHSRGDRLTCTCGASWRYTETAFLEPSQPFPDLARWEDWQKKQLRDRDFIRNGDSSLFSDSGCALSRILKEHRERQLGTGDLILDDQALTCAGHRFEMTDIREMDMVRHHILLFTTGDGYYQIRAEGQANLRKYLEIWKQKQEKT